MVHRDLFVGGGFGYIIREGGLRELVGFDRPVVLGLFKVDLAVFWDARRDKYVHSVYG